MPQYAIVEHFVTGRKNDFPWLQGCKPDVSAEKGLGNTRKRVCGFLYGAADRFLAAAWKMNLRAWMMSRYALFVSAKEK
jgi:hypothetical protein